MEEKAYPGPLSHEKLSELVDVMDHLKMSKEEEIKFTKLYVKRNSDSSFEQYYLCSLLLVQ